jgi:hypothetical protein
MNYNQYQLFTETFVDKEQLKKSDGDKASTGHPPALFGYAIVICKYEYVLLWYVHLESSSSVLTIPIGFNV